MKPQIAAHSNSPLVPRARRRRQPLQTDAFDRGPECTDIVIEYEIASGLCLHSDGSVACNLKAVRAALNLTDMSLPDRKDARWDEAVLVFSGSRICVRVPVERTPGVSPSHHAMQIRDAVRTENDNRAAVCEAPLAHVTEAECDSKALNNLGRLLQEGEKLIRQTGGQPVSSKIRIGEVESLSMTLGAGNCGEMKKARRKVQTQLRARSTGIKLEVIEVLSGRRILAVGSDRRSAQVYELPVGRSVSPGDTIIAEVRNRAEREVSYYQLILDFSTS